VLNCLSIGTTLHNTENFVECTGLFFHKAAYYPQIYFERSTGQNMGTKSSMFGTFSACFLVFCFVNFLLFSFQCLNLDTNLLNERTIEFIDIAYDEVNPKHYKEEEVGIVNVVSSS
jgi:hypothetical protein